MNKFLWILIGFMPFFLACHSNEPKPETPAPAQVQSAPAPILCHYYAREFNKPKSPLEIADQVQSVSKINFNSEYTECGFKDNKANYFSYRGPKSVCAAMIQCEGASQPELEVCAALDNGHCPDADTCHALKLGSASDQSSKKLGYSCAPVVIGKEANAQACIGRLSMKKGDVISASPAKDGVCRPASAMKKDRCSEAEVPAEIDHINR